MNDVHRVGLVFASHSADLAAGLVAVARQMAPSVHLVAAGGADDGSIGTSFAKIDSGIASADSGHGVVILGDLGSARMTAETAISLLDADAASRVRLVDAPFVEGGVAAAVAAEHGASLERVADAALGVVRHFATPTERTPMPNTTSARSSVTVTLTDPDGLHARPAAEVARIANSLDVPLTINGVPATSMLSIMALGLDLGSEVVIASDHPESAEAVAAVAAVIRTGWAEPPTAE